MNRFSSEFAALLRKRRDHLREHGIRVSHAQGGGTYTVYKDPPEGVDGFKKEYLLIRSTADDDKVTLGFECVDRPSPELEPELMIEEPEMLAIRTTSISPELIERYNNFQSVVLRLLATPAPPNYG